MSYPQNHRDEGDRASWNPNPPSFQANGHKGAYTSTPIQTPSMTNGLRNNQLVGDQTILNNHLPGPAKFQTPRQGPKFSDQDGCVPKFMEKPLDHHDAGVGQVSQRLKRTTPSLHTRLSFRTIHQQFKIFHEPAVRIHGARNVINKREALQVSSNGSRASPSGSV